MPYDIQQLSYESYLRAQDSIGVAEVEAGLAQLIEHEVANCSERLESLSPGQRRVLAHLEVVARHKRRAAPVRVAALRNRTYQFVLGLVGLWCSMRSFQRASTLDPVPGDVVGLLRAIDRAAGSEARHLDQLPQLLETLRDQARVESITASSAIEGVTVDNSRVPVLVSGASRRFRTRSEAEFAGYTAALDLQHCGYGVGRYVSLEQRIFESKDGYYDALAASTTSWFDDGAHDLRPWARYLLGRLGDAYARFEARTAASASGGTKQDRIRDFVLLHAPANFTIADIRTSVPGVSDNTIRLVLAGLKQLGRIESSGTGRGATWHRM